MNGQPEMLMNKFLARFNSYEFGSVTEQFITVESVIYLAVCLSSP